MKITGLVDDGLALFSVFEAVALGQTVLDPYSIYVVGSFAWYQAQLFRTFVPLAPALLVLLLYAWVARLILRISRRRSAGLDRFVGALLQTLRGGPRMPYDRFVFLRHPRVLLIIAIIVAGLLGFFPYLPSLNPDGNLVGVDTPTYVYWTGQMLARPPPQAIAYALGEADQGFRPIPLLLLYSIASLGIGAEQAVKFFPVVLAPLLTFSSYIFVETGSGDKRTAAVTALVSCFCFNVTVGIWAGYLANWLAIIFGYLFFAGFFLFADSRRKILLGPLALTSLALLLTHPWTWSLVLATSLVFALTRSRPQRSFLTAVSLVLILAGVIVDFVKNYLVGSATLAADLGTKGPVFGISQFLNFWPNLGGALMVFYDGLLGNSLFLGLGVVAFLGMKTEGKRDGLLYSWVASTSLPFAFLNSFHQTRLIYDLPIPPLVAMGVLLLMSRVGGGNLRASLVMLAVLLFSANFALAGIIQA